MGLVKAREKNIRRTNKLVKDFMQFKISLDKFRNDIARRSKNELGMERKSITRMWGANGFKGIMLLTLLFRYSTKGERVVLGKVLKKCFIVPGTIDETAEKIDLFSKHIGKISESITPEKIKESEYPDKSWKHIKYHQKFMIFICS